MTVPYKPPEFEADAFNCPRCGAYAHQDWFGFLLRTSGGIAPQGRALPSDSRFIASICGRCGNVAIWLKEALIYPLTGGAPPPNEDLPEEIQADYQEANAIAGLSPRGAAALLRLAIQKLCKHLGESGKDINIDIGSLVKKGLSVSVQQALDSVRVIGNEAVHPGTLDLRDDPKLASALFRLVNLIAQKMISEPNEIAGIYSSLPPAKLKGIEQRDKGKQTK